MQKILVLGSEGQLGQCLQSQLPVSFDVEFLSRIAFDVTNVDAMRSSLDRLRPDGIVNCAAYTNVDGAESNEDVAASINHLGILNLARLCVERRVKIIHVSTDFVFDGRASKPYCVDDICSPLGVYGETKLLGEAALTQIMPDDAMILRTSWLYSEYGSNFVKTMLKLFETKVSFGVVNDQYGSPTYAQGLAALIWHVLEEGNFSPGIFHWCDAGVTNWYEFANEIGRRALNKGIFVKKAATVPIHSSEYPTAASRPMYSALNCDPTLDKYTSVRQIPWQDQLDFMLDVLIDQKVNKNVL